MSLAFRKRHIIVLLIGLALIAIGGYIQYLRSPYAKVFELLAEVRTERNDGLFTKLLIKLKLRQERHGRSVDEVEADLAAMGRDAVPALCDALEDDDAQVVLSAITVLAEMKDPRAFEPMIALLRRPHAMGYPEGENYGFNPQYLLRDAVARAARGIGLLRDPRGVEPLARLLDQEDYTTQLVSREYVPAAQAVDALAEIGNDHALAVLINQVVQAGPGQYCEGFIELGLYAEHLSRFGRRAVDPLIKLLDSDDPSVVIQAAEALRLIGDHRASRPLAVTYLAAREYHVYLASPAIQAKLGKEWKDSAIQESTVRWYLLRTIVSMDDDEAADALRFALRCPTGDVSQWQDENSMSAYGLLFDSNGSWANYYILLNAAQKLHNPRLDQMLLEVARGDRPWLPEDSVAAPWQYSTLGNRLWPPPPWRVARNIAEGQQSANEESSENAPATE